jgi:hypothetical protein
MMRGYFLGKSPSFHAILLSDMLRPREFFEDQELVLIYVAKRLREARAIEEALNCEALDYIVIPEQYTGGVFFTSKRVGAFFYISPAFMAQARTALLTRGFIPIDDPHSEDRA